MANTTRLDVLIVERSLLPTRQVAQAAIMDGGVLVDGTRVTKPGTQVKPTSVIEISDRWTTPKFVSRGGQKLERALDAFSIDIKGRICLDLGASTGGFTDVLLQRGAQLVYAIDVGYGQLDWKLRQDERVIVKERTNARHLKPAELYDESATRADFAVADLSFISILKVIPAALDLLAESGESVALIKPQFEAGRDAVGKGGVVREKSAHIGVLRKVLAAAATLGLYAADLTYSPVKGPAGNIEFLVHWKRKPADSEVDIEAVVEKAHSQLHSV